MRTMGMRPQDPGRAGAPVEPGEPGDDLVIERTEPRDGSEDGSPRAERGRDADDVA